MSNPRRTALVTLAERAGILPAYIDVAGRRRTASDATRRALLAALGMDVSTDRRAIETLAELDRKREARLLVPVGIARPPARTMPITVQLPPRIRGGAYRLEIADERGEVWERTGRLRRARDGTARLTLGRSITPGYYRVRVTVEPGGRSGEQLLVVTPSRCTPPAERLGRRRAFGIMANLYTLRSETNWGVGDLTDLTALGAWAARCGAAFVAINPLHALLNQGDAVSPYSPLSRLFRNPLYLDPAAVPELVDSPTARARLQDVDHRAALERLRRQERVDYAGVMALKRPLLEALHRAFTEREANDGSARGRAYQRYRAAQGEALTGFATYLALADRHGPRWRDWPAELRRPNGRAVLEYRRAHDDAIDYHCWVQFELDAQLGRAAGGTRLALGLLGDLAIGADPDGADTWSSPDLFVAGASLGAPPDAGIPAGQDWGLVPLAPHALAARRFDYWILMLRTALRHMGGLRLDHVMGLFRQYWIPPGGSPADGAYVRFPSEPLLAILALESARARAVIVGEDIGTVPRGLPAALRRWGILSTRMLYFEQEGGGFRPAQRYSGRALVTVNTHDHPTLAGYWSGRDLDLRYAVGDIVAPAALRRARAVRERERAALARRLVRDRLLRSPPAPSSPGGELTAAVHTFLARTPAPLVGLSLDDLVGETEPVNLPGVGPDRYPSWRRRLTPALEAITASPDVRRAMGDQRRRARVGAWPAS